MGENSTTLPYSATEHSISRLIRKSKETQIPWIVNGLWQEGGIAVVHSLEEEFKSVFAYQLAHSVAAGSPLLRCWDVPKIRRVGVLETEMDDLEVGNRLARMYPQGDFPTDLILSNEELIKEFRRKVKQPEKFQVVDRWIRENHI